MNITKRRSCALVGLATLALSVGCKTPQTAISPTIAAAPDKPSAPLSEASSAAVPFDSSEDGSFVVQEGLQPVFFETSQSRIPLTALNILKSNVQWLQQNPPYLVQIVGYADTRGSLKRNRSLAERRALKIRDFYVEAGLPKDRFAVVVRNGGSTFCQDLTEECLSRNRRAETLVENKSLPARS